ncbi:MAG: tryptophan-rich sensory protein [Deltaproteobacteria bacterium]|nr:tryptophan-rich sensory protein [Deltaproteobacteria bacterium]
MSPPFADGSARTSIAPHLPGRHSRLLRWLALTAVVGNVLYNYLYSRLGLPSMREVSDRYLNLFTPAPYAFAIWGVIYAGFVVFAVVALTRAHREDRAYDGLAALLVIANALAALWITLFSYDQVWPCAAVIAATLVTAIAMYTRADGAVIRGGSAWLRVPFALFLGWVSVATIANLAAAFTSTGFQGGGAGPVPWAVGMLAIAAALGAWIGVRYRDPVVPAVVAWAAFAIHISDLDANRSAAVAALIAAIATAVTAIWLLGSRMLGHASSPAPIGHADARHGFRPPPD